jgi:DNA ligase (NAD+)
MQKETTIEGVEFSMGKNRRISPVALLAPVNLGGVTIKRASLHNFDIFKSFNLGKGDIVLISRRNDVIPGIEKVIKHNGKKFEIPTKCPICNSVLELGDKFLICPNDECQGLYIGNLYKWITNLEIMDIGERIIELLYNNNKIKEPADFYKLKVTDFMNIEGMGQKSGQKIIDHLQEKTNITLSDFIGGLNMNNFSNSIAENLMNNGIDTLEKMQKATINDLIKIKGIETKTAEKIITGLKTKEKVINNLLKYITIKVKEKVMSKSKVLSGKSFVFTGGVKRIDDNGDRWTRDMLSDLVIENGGEVQSSVNKNTTYLVQADPSSQSTKTKKAISLGVTILGEDNFFDMMNM